MKKKPGRKGVPWLPIVIAVCLALGAGYFIGKRGSGQVSQPTPMEKDVASREVDLKAAPESPVRENIHVGKVEGPLKPEEGDECRKVREDLKNFFDYLDKKPYVQQIEPGISTQQWFTRVVARLSANPPVPAGERLNPVAMTNHVFYFFRNLDPKEMRLIRDVMVNEETTLEANLDLFFRWVTLGSRCPELGGVRPSPEVLYSYAGFFLNTIGGRAYLFRTSPGVRLLLTYYCLMIVHDADKRGKNTYGINLAPHLKSLTTEMSYQGDFLFQKEYLKNLEELHGFYRRR
jgi:hypothetical protein